MGSDTSSEGRNEFVVDAAPRDILNHMPCLQRRENAVRFGRAFDTDFVSDEHTKIVEHAKSTTPLP